MPTIGWVLTWVYITVVDCIEYVSPTRYFSPFAFGKNVSSRIFSFHYKSKLCSYNNIWEFPLKGQWETSDDRTGRQSGKLKFVKKNSPLPKKPHASRHMSNLVTESHSEGSKNPVLRPIDPESLKQLFPLQTLLLHTHVAHSDWLQCDITMVTIVI